MSSSSSIRETIVDTLAREGVDVSGYTRYVDAVESALEGREAQISSAILAEARTSGFAEDEAREVLARTGITLPVVYEEEIEEDDEDDEEDDTVATLADTMVTLGEATPGVTEARVREIVTESVNAAIAAAVERYLGAVR